MNDSAWIWPASDMDFWKIDNKETSVKIKWSHNCFEDYKTLSYQFYKCGYKTFEEVIGSGHDNVKSDMWFLTGIFLVRHSIELGLKALLCRVLPRKRDIEDAFEACCHDVSMLFHKYTDVRLENYLTEEEEDWLIRYLDSLEEVDKKSDMFRFPFEDEFLSKYRDKFLDNLFLVARCRSWPWRWLVPTCGMSSCRSFSLWKSLGVPVAWLPAKHSELPAIQLCEEGSSSH